MLDGTLVKVVAWYDNEWGYSNRCVDLVQRVLVAPPRRPATGRSLVRTLDDLDVAGQRVLVRVDFNVPLDGGRVTDDTRIRAALPTIEELRGSGARLVLVSHLGRPKDREPELSLRPAAERLGELLGREVRLAPAVVGPEAQALAAGLGDGDVLMLENVRYEPGETQERPGAGRRAGRARRRLRQRRLRRRAPRARLDRGRGPPPARAAAGRLLQSARSRRSPASSRIPGPPARGRRRRREGDRQDRA